MSGAGVNVADLELGELSKLPDDQFRLALAKLIDLQQRDRREMQILYYQPNQENAWKIHESQSHIIGVGGGNRSGKTESVLVEMVALATGVFPMSIAHLLRPKWRNGPINCRFCLESLTTVLHPVMLPKLQYWKWEGVDEPGGDRGHWGWVPRMCLIDGSWERSWSEKLRTLTVLCRDPDHFDKVLGESQIQFLSYDQDPSDFASGSFDIVAHDEPPTYAIWRENQPRVWDRNGRAYVQMTWPDDPAIPVDWIYDEIYEPGRKEGNKEIAWFDLLTLENSNVNRDAVLEKARGMSAEQQAVRMRGQPIRFANRIHGLFTDTQHDWCFSCQKQVYIVGKVCHECGSEDVSAYCHVAEFDHAPFWPVIYALDPHPRKPHMMIWSAVTPNDDIFVIAEAEVDGEPVLVKEAVDEIEETYGLNVVLRLMDPNMGASPANARAREVTWQDEFADAGLRCDFADSSDVGRARVNEYLRPDQHTTRPRLIIHERCHNTILQMKRYSWDDHKRSQDKDQKQSPRNKYDDYPSMLRYTLNVDPEFGYMSHGPRPVPHPSRRA